MTKIFYASPQDSVSVQFFVCNAIVLARVVF